ncbi:Peptidylprolyl isomerase [Gracilaria domingensis]|nr:Peptidylprolyl isomerase [Gracilaria domingensis]
MATLPLAFSSPVPGRLGFNCRPTVTMKRTRETVVATGGRPLVNVTGTAALAVLAASILSNSPMDVSKLSEVPIIPPALAAKGGGASFFNASGDVIKDPESLLRWSLPISNKPVREVQAGFEAAVNDTRGLKWPKIDNDLKRAQMVLNNQVGKILMDVPEERIDEATQILAKVSDQIPAIESAVTEKNADKLIKNAKEVLRNIGKVEELMVTGFPFKVPEEYLTLPRLLGRATVELVVRKAEDEPFDIEGTIYKEGKMTLVLDGYSAPLSAGTFVDLVNKGFYNETAIIRSDGFVIQGGKPQKGEGYVDKESGKIRQVPLEVFARGDNEPTYGITLEEDGRGTSSTVLPFTSYGTLALAREEFEPNTASSQFFWFLFEPDLTPAGRNLMDGSWAVFGYTTQGENFLKGLQKGDRIVSATVVDGIQNLVT